jgi:hypothetical protein
LNAVSLYARSPVVVVVGEMRLDLDDVRLLHILVTVSREWTYVRLAKEMSSRYGGSWDRQKIGRRLGRLRRNGLVESEGFDTVRLAVHAVAEQKKHNPASGSLWREMGSILAPPQRDDPLEAIWQRLRELAEK